MLKFALTHPPLLEALASAGHGSMVLLADGNYPYATARHRDASLVHLNVRPGVLTVPEVLEAVLPAVNFEAATVMDPGEGRPAKAEQDYRRLLGPSVPFERVDRFDFYDLARSAGVGLVVATGDERLYANLLLCVGLRQ